MKVDSGNNSNNKPSTLKVAVQAGALTAGMQSLLLPSETKAAIKNTILGEDVFLSRTVKAGLKNIEKLHKSGNESIANKINISQSVKNAKEMYPEFVKTAKPAMAMIGRTFASVSLGVVAGRVLSEVLFGDKAKEEKAYSNKN